MGFRSQLRGLLLKMLLGSYLVFVTISYFLGFEPGMQISQNFLTFSVTIFKILPVAFLLIGLFDVWIKHETVEKHLGKDSGLLGYLWAILLSGMVVGPLYVALPVAHSFLIKRARIGVILTYLGASAICRIPMAIFETSFLGLKFTAIRFVVSLPLVLVSSMILERYLNNIQYTIMEQND